MTDAQKDGASIAGFFDEFNKDADKQAVMEDVNRKLCEVLTELAEDLVEALSEAGGADAGADAAASVGDGAAEAEAGAEGASGGVDEVAAMSAYNDALAAILREKEVTSKDICALPTEHPLKEMFFSAFDQQMFHDLMERFIAQVRSRQQGPGEWDAEAAEGECDEDHTLE